MLSTQDPDFFLARQLRPEARLLLCCARTETSPCMIECVRTLVSTPLDWEFLCNSAEKHRVTQLLFRHLSEICPDSIPRGIKLRLRHQFYTNAGSNLKLARALTDLLPKFSIEGIPVIPFKGSILANGTYGKLALRQNYDLDLFIREQDVGKSRQLLAEQGYDFDEKFDGEARFRNAASGVEIDLHWAFTPRYFHYVAKFDELHARTRAESLMGQAVITFSPEDFLLILCLQVVKDCWERQQRLEHLSKVCDIAEHLRAHPQLDWEPVILCARQKGLERIFHCGLIMARELLGAELPQQILSTIESDYKARKCAQKMCRSLFTKDDTLSPLENPYFSMGLRFRQLWFYLGIRERFRERIKHLGEIFKFYRLART